MERPLNPARLTPMAREILGARDEILAVLDRLDSATAGTALAYAGATWATREAEARDDDPATWATALVAAIVEATLQGVIPHATVGTVGQDGGAVT